MPRGEVCQEIHSRCSDAPPQPKHLGLEPLKRRLGPLAIRGYFLPTNRTLSVNALPCPPANVPKSGASMLFTTTSEFLRPSALTASIRAAHKYPRKPIFFSSARFRFIYGGYRFRLGAPTSCCWRFTTLKGYPVRYSKK